MQVLIVFCHPAPDSFQRSLLDALASRLEGDGHALRVLDLYGEGFDPVLALDGWRAHRRDQPHPEELQGHLQALAEAEALVLVYPTWWYGLPAMLKGWIDRVWQPGLAFSMQGGAFQLHTLGRLKRFGVITTYGSPRAFIEWVVGDPARRQLMRGLKRQLAKGAKGCWAPIYSVDVRSREDLARARAAAVERIVRLLAS